MLRRPYGTRTRDLLVESEVSIPTAPTAHGSWRRRDGRSSGVSRANVVSQIRPGHRAGRSRSPGRPTGFLPPAGPASFVCHPLWSSQPSTPFRAEYAQGEAGAAGFEPATGGFGGRCATRLRHTPVKVVVLQRKRRPIPGWVGGASAVCVRYRRRLPRLGLSLAVTSVGRPTQGMPANPHSLCRCGSDEACHNMSMTPEGRWCLAVPR